ncbi:hypothetical protein [Tropicibacter sp. S64]|uniref:hypothetical protein n=1 Tax=Tropicibacter sp. S64 TaxID=3415122 RepID=UPI003C7AB1AA
MIRSVFLAAALVLGAGCASAATLFSADTATTTAGHHTPSSFGYTAQLIDQGSFSTPFVSGVTDFDSFVASTSATGGTTQYGSFALPLPVNLDFGFSQLLSLSRLALWNQTGGASVQAFTLLGSASGAFDDLVSLGSYSAVHGNDGQVFTFGAADLRGIRMSITSNFGSTGTVRLQEVAFGGAVATAAVPLPASLPLLVFGLASAMACRRRRKTAGSRS